MRTAGSAAALVAFALLTVAPAAAAAVPAAGSRIFTLAGGGGERPRDGALATSIRIGDRDDLAIAVAALPDGSIATVGPGGDPLLIGLDGRVRLLPPVRDGRDRVHVSLLAAERDGGLLAAGTRLGSRHIHRLAPGQAEWTRAVSFERILRRRSAWTVAGIAAMPDGSIAFSGYDGLRRAFADGRIERLDAGRRGTQSPRSLVALPDGALAFSYGRGSDIAVLPPDGSVQRLTRGFSTFDAPGLAAMPDGTLLRAAGSVDALTAGRGFRPIAGHRPGLGTGDGGDPADAQLHAADVAVAGDGAIVIAESSPFGPSRPRWDLPAYREPGGRLLSESISGLDEDYLLRIIVPPDSPRALAAVGSGTFTGLPSGHVEVVTTRAGQATVTVDGGAGPGRRVEQHVAAGSTTLALPAGVRSGDHEVALGLVAEDGRHSAADLAVTTARRLSIRRARRIVRRIDAQNDDVGYYTRTGACRRASAISVECQSISVIYDGARERPTCDTVGSATLRPDGVRVTHAYGRRRCRALAAAAG